MRINVKQIGFLTLFVLLILMSGCKTGRKVTETRKTVKMETEMIRRVLEQQIADSPIEIKCSGKARTGEQSINFQGTIRIEKDQAVWVSLRSGIGIEIARVLAEPDSVWINSRLLRIKEKGNWKLLEEYSGYPLNFIAFQGILLRRLFSWSTDNPDRLLDELRYRPDKDGNWIFALPESGSGDDKSGVGFRFLTQTPGYRIESVDMINQDNDIIGRVFYQYDENAIIKRISIKGAEKSNDIGLDMDIKSYEVIPDLDISYKKW